MLLVVMCLMLEQLDLVWNFRMVHRMKLDSVGSWFAVLVKQRAKR